MAEVFAPFRIERTMCSLTFYMMEGRNFVRKKSALTRRKVLHSPQFKNTRHFAGLMGRASKIGSQVYNALPEYWRQGWMYRSFTGEAYTMLTTGKREEEQEAGAGTDEGGRRKRKWPSVHDESEIEIRRNE